MSIRNDPGLAIDLCRSEKEKMLAPKDLNGFLKKKKDNLSSPDVEKC